MIRVAFATDGIFPYALGGIQKYSYELINKLAQYQEFEITVFHPHHERVFQPSPNLTEVIVPIPEEKGPYIYSCWRYSKLLAKKIKSSGEFDIIYGQGITIWSEIEQLSGVKITNFHGLEPFQPYGKLNWLKTLPLMWAIRSILKKSDITINEGGLLGNILQNQKLPNTKIIQIPNGVNLVEGVKRSFENKKTLNFLVLCRIAENKGIPYLIEAFKKVLETSSQVVLHVAGDGPIRKKLESENIHPQIIFHGRISEQKKEELLNHCDLFVFPTLFEGMPTVILEAMAHGIPIVATRVGGIPELVDITNGMLISKGSVMELTNAMKEFIKMSPQQKHKLSEGSLIKVKAFSWEKVTQQHVEVFKKIKEKSIA